MQILKLLQAQNRSSLFVGFAFAASVLALLAVSSLTVADAGFPQTFPCKSGSWQVLVGEVDSVDPGHKNFDVRIRAGGRAVPQRLINEDWAKLRSSMAEQFSVYEFALHVRPDANQKAKFQITSGTKVFRQTSEGLDTLNAGQVESGAPVLLVLAAGQCWPSSEAEISSLEFQPRIEKMVLLQACIEESCVKAKCKGKKDCKETVCNCEHAQ